METKLIKFKKEHLDCMDIRSHEQVLLSQTEHLTALEGGLARTGIVDGRVIACGGVLPFMSGLADVWLIPSVYVVDYKYSFCRELRTFFEDVQRDLCLHRMQSVCINDDLHHNFMTFFGFEKEGVMKKYYNNEDYVMYGRIAWD